MSNQEHLNCHSGGKEVQSELEHAKGKLMKVGHNLSGLMMNAGKAINRARQSFDINVHAGVHAVGEVITHPGKSLKEARAFYDIDGKGQNINAGIGVTAHAVHEVATQNPKKTAKKVDDFYGISDKAHTVGAGIGATLHAVHEVATTNPKTTAKKVDEFYGIHDKLNTVGAGIGATAYAINDVATHNPKDTINKVKQFYHLDGKTGQKHAESKKVHGEQIKTDTALVDEIMSKINVHSQHNLTKIKS